MMESEDYRGRVSADEISSILANATLVLTARTGAHFKLRLDLEDDGYTIRCEREDGYHCALKGTLHSILIKSDDGNFVPLQDPDPKRRHQRWLGYSVQRDVEAIIRGHKAQQAGIAPEDWWKNDPGEVFATIANGTVDVRQWDTQGGLMAPNSWAFYIGDTCAYRISKKLTGPVPTVEVLDALWETYQDGISAGERLGFKEGRRSLKRELGALLKEEA